MVLLGEILALAQQPSVRNENGDVIGVKGIKLPDSSNIVTEVIAIREGLKFCIDMQLTPVIIETGSLTMELKTRLTTALVLTLPEGIEGFVIHCDASKGRLGCVLMQKGKVIAYAFDQLKIHEWNYVTHDLKLAAIAFALKIWFHYLFNVHVDVFTDHKSLQYVFSQKELNLRQMRWLALFKDYDMSILYYPGSQVENQKVASVKVLWRNQFFEKAIWEAEKDMKTRYSHLFFFDLVPVPGINSS
ncbi:hypothetical protein MTR67_040410 [Solanum verrucosum]|uniref:Reverse transcriptase RNase H-like domain-containing protein n=1 Tax=Solanum verrucosum TaxID=315347 RepID=A0AAF0UJR5_SOLVR|nr:hypothetical protein MTR67_040410 [Solanum verrucosum]